MTFHELKNKLETEKHQTGMIRVKCGKRSDFPDLPIIYTEDIRDLPYTLRIYEENNCWHNDCWYIVYANGRGRIFVLDHGNKEDMTETFYRLVLDIEKRYKKEFEELLDTFRCGVERIETHNE